MNKKKNIVWDEDTNTSVDLEDLRDMLCTPADGEIICIADIGRWNGRREGYQLVGQRLSNILYAREDVSVNRFYDDGKDICHEEAHHDGTNYYIYRVLKGKDHDEQVENAEKLYNGHKVTRRRIAAYTRSLRPAVLSAIGLEV